MRRFIAVSALLAGGRVLGAATALAILGLALALGLGIAALRGVGRYRRLVKLACALSLPLLVLTACQSPVGQVRKTADSKADAAQSVLIAINGDVLAQGQRLIRRDFTAESIREAGGGWRVRSLGGFSPVAFRLEREINGETKAWTIRFDEMHRRKWREFRFEEGDRVFVCTAIF